MKLELTEGDSLEGSDDTPMYNPHILPLRKSPFFYIVYCVEIQQERFSSLPFMLTNTPCWPHHQLTLWEYHLYLTFTLG